MQKFTFIFVLQDLETDVYDGKTTTSFVLSETSTQSGLSLDGNLLFAMTFFVSSRTSWMSLMAKLNWKVIIKILK